MLGLLGSAMAGGAQAVSQVSEGRIEEKRAKALEKLRTMNNRAEGAIRFGQEQTLADTENSRRVAQDATAFTRQQGLAATDNENAIKRIRLADELGNNAYTDVLGLDGKTVIGQRDENNKLTQFGQAGGRYGQGLSKEDWTRLKYAHGVKNDRLKELQEMSRDPMIEVDEKMTTEMAALNTEVQELESLIFGNGSGGGQTLAELLSNLGAAGTGTGNPAKAEKPAPESIGGLVGGAMKTGETQARVKVATDQINGLQDEADKLLQRIERPSVMGSIGKPGSRPQADSDAIEAAQDLVQRLLALEDDPAMAEALTPRLRNNIKQRIMDIQRAGVPLNLNQ